MDLLHHVLSDQAALIDMTLKLEHARQAAPDHFAEEIFGKVQDIMFTGLMEPAFPVLAAHIQAQTDTFDELRDHMADILLALREQYHVDDPGPVPSWFARPTAQPEP